MGATMITVHLRYEIDADKLADFAEYGRRWIRLVNRLGGTHHGYFLPSEGDSDEAFALFSFPSLAAYEGYRTAAAVDPSASRPTGSRPRPSASGGTSAGSSRRCSSDGPPFDLSDFDGSETRSEQDDDAGDGGCRGQHECDHDEHDVHGVERRAAAIGVHGRAGRRRCGG